MGSDGWSGLPARSSTNGWSYKVLPVSSAAYPVHPPRRTDLTVKGSKGAYLLSIARPADIKAPFPQLRKLSSSCSNLKRPKTAFAPTKKSFVPQLGRHLVNKSLRLGWQSLISYCDAPEKDRRTVYRSCCKKTRISRLHSEGRASTIGMCGTSG